jgi:hypothetical protein
MFCADETVNRIRAAVAELDSVRAAAVPVIVRVEVRGAKGELLEVLDYQYEPATNASVS